MGSEERVLLEDEIDLKEYLYILWKWRWVIALVTVAAIVTAGVLSYFVLPPIYEARAVLLVASAADQQRAVRQEGGLEELVNTLSRLPEMTINTYMGQLKSPALLRQVAEKVNSEIRGENPMTATGLAQIIKTERARDTNLIEVTVTRTDPEEAALIANILTEEYLEFLSESSRRQASKSVEFLNEQLAVAEQELKEAQQQLEAFGSDARSVAFLRRELDDLVSARSRYRVQLAAAEVRLNLLAAARSRLEEQLQDTPQFITVEEIPQESGVEAPLDGGTRVLKREINPVWTTLRTELDAGLVEIAEKQAEIGMLKGFISDAEKEIGLLQKELTEKDMTESRLTGTVQRLQKNYDLLAEKITETRVAQSANFGETSVLVVSPAFASADPVRPRKMLNMAIAGVLGLMLSVFLAFVLNHLDNTVKVPRDIERLTGLPNLGTIPRVTS